ncbi:hypothetical protein JOD62_002658 [Microbacterium keratanolyticum]|uniref:Uncharacterized protein n=1 Tax=Microbacterium keratanolyticum TaxID=67574 RepID=A0A9W6HT75_9MICO|nr:hypothetical protein [Microbacterium keratanolyticum]MBM7470110.1 hypothetical protein [Microbacterium keratanolyticum]GLK02189.1 hypothetical protein GCM10017596_19040 [Microbacterium keratanolyticum]
MTPIAIAVLCGSITLLWGGLIASAVFLARRPEVDIYPFGGYDDGREDELVHHDT